MSEKPVPKARPENGLSSGPLSIYEEVEFDGYSGAINRVEDSDMAVAIEMYERDAYRMSLCWNFLRGIPTDMLREMVFEFDTLPSLLAGSGSSETLSVQYFNEIKCLTDCPNYEVGTLGHLRQTVVVEYEDGREVEIDANTEIETLAPVDDEGMVHVGVLDEDIQFMIDANMVMV